MVLQRDTMNPPNTALGNAFAQMMKNNQIKTVPMNTEINTTASTEVTTEQAYEYTNTRIDIPNQVIEREFVNVWAAENDNANGLITKEQLAAAVDIHGAKDSNGEDLKAYEDNSPTPGVARTEQALGSDDGAKPGKDEYPDPEAVLHSVESRTTSPRHKKPMQKPPVHKEIKPVQKKAPALFALSENRPASALLKNIFDTSTIDGVDGVDHINIHNDGITKLGRLLDMNAKTPFVHPELGMFQCVGGMWHYIKTRPMVEEYRVLHGAQLRYKANQVKKESMDNYDAPQSLNIPGFKTIMADAMWHKVTQNNEIVQLMAESTLPFEHYFTQGALNIRQYPSEGYWTAAAFEEIRRVIKHRLETGDNDAQPDFSKLEDMRNPRAGIDKPVQRPGRRDPSPYGRPRQQESYFNRGR